MVMRMCFSNPNPRNIIMLFMWQDFHIVYQRMEKVAYIVTKQYGACFVAALKIPALRSESDAALSKVPSAQCSI